MAADSTNNNRQENWSNSREQQFDQLFRTVFPLLHFYVCQRGLPEQDAQDLIQECFVKIWDKHVELNNFDYCKNLLFRMVRHKMIDRWRQQQSHPQLEFSDLDHIAEPAMAEEALIQAEMMHWLVESIRHLPQRISEVCDLYYIQGQDDTAISQQLDRSIHTIRNQRRRGVELLMQASVKKNPDTD